MMATKHFDAVVLGSGQGGTPLATALAQAGHKTALVERTHIGGCCINEGCTPTKTMIASGRVAHVAGRAKDYGVWQKHHIPAHVSVLSEGMEAIKPRVKMSKVRDRKREIVKSFREGSENRLKSVDGLEVVMGEASFAGPHLVDVRLLHGEAQERIEADYFFINVGARPAEPELDGLKEVKAKQPHLVLDSTSVMELKQVPEKLVVIGGGYIAVEFGQLFQRLGSEVTILQRGRQLLEREDPEIAQEVKKICEGEGMIVHLNTAASSVSLENDRLMHVTCRRGGESEDLKVEATQLLLAVGRKPNTDSLNLPSAGVETDHRGFVNVSSSLQTNIPHIFCLGDAKGGPQFTHISYDDYRILKANCIKRSVPPLTIEQRVVPYVVYMDPQLGHVGLHEAEARKKWPDKHIMTATMPMSYVARALETDETRGMMKAVVDGMRGEILGFTCLGVEGGEIMSLVQVAMMGKLPWMSLRDACFAHPTLAESLNNLWSALK